MIQDRVLLLWNANLKPYPSFQVISFSFFNDIERPLTQISRSHHFWRWISQKRYKIRTMEWGLHTLYSRCHFEWSWATFSQNIQWHAASFDLCLRQLSFLFCMWSVVEVFDSIASYGFDCHSYAGNIQVQSGAEKSGPSWVCEHNLRKLLLNNGFILVEYRCQR